MGFLQGTAGVALAGLLGAVRAQGKPTVDFPKQKIVVAGAGRFDLLSIGSELFKTLYSMKRKHSIIIFDVKKIKNPFFIIEYRIFLFNIFYENTWTEPISHVDLFFNILKLTGNF